MPTQQENELLGKAFGAYRIVREIGRGGMGVVYLAQDLALDRPVALKMLPAMLAIDGDYVERFYREAKTAAKLVHPNVVTVHAVGSNDGRHYIAMEYVKGRTLAEEIKKRAPLDVHAALKIAGQVAAALAAANELGILHRDIKPANIMLGEQGLAKVMDFGVAKIQADSSGIASTDGLTGTLTYMAPEVCRNQPADHRSDIYALGVVLYEALAGKPPYSDPADLQLMMKIIEQPLPPIRQSNSRVQAPVVMILEKALAKNPDQRYATAEEMKSAIEHVLGGGGSIPGAVRAASPAAGVEAGIKAIKGKSAKPGANPATGASKREGGPGLKMAAIAVAFVLALGIGGWLVSGFFTRGGAKPLGPSGMSANSAGLVADLRGHGEGVSCARFSPDGRHIFSSGGDGKILMWDAATGSMIKPLVGHKGWVYGLAVSPTGRHVISGGFDQAVRLWGVVSGLEIRRMDRENEGGTDHIIKSVAFSPDGKRAASGAFDKMVRLWDIETGKQSKVFTGHTGSVESVAYSMDGSMIASGSADKTIRLWQVSEEKEFRRMEGHAAAVNCVALSPDGLRILSSSIDGSARLWDAAAGQEIKRVEGFPLGAYSAAFSPSGKRALLGCGDGKVHLCDAESLKTIKVYEGHTDAVWTVAFAPDGRTAASGSMDKSIRIWKID